MLRRRLALVAAVALLPSTAMRAEDPAPIAGQAFFAAVSTLACALFVVGDANPDDETGPERRGFYGASHFLMQGGGDGLGFNVAAGYRCHPNFAYEFEYTRIGDAGSGLNEADYWTVTNNIKGYLSRTRIQPFVSLGLGVIRAVRDVDASVNLDHTVKLGGGIDYYVSDHIAVSLNGHYIVPTGGASDLHDGFAGLGLLYRH